MEVKQKKTILIFGISSFVGSNLAEYLKKDFRVVGTYYKSRVTIPGVLTLPCNVLAKEEVQLVLYSVKPDFTIYSVGLSSLYSCSMKEGLAEALNTSGLFNVAEYCQRYKSQVVYLSSNFVFAGEQRRYLEMDIPDSNNLYGKTQASAEFYIQKTLLNYLVLRCCRLYGRGVNPRNPTWFESLQSEIAQHKTVKYDDYLRVGFLDVYYLAMILKICFEKGASNRLFQVSTQDIMTFYQFAECYSEVFNESKGFVSKSKWKFPYLKSGALMTLVDEMGYDLDIGNIEGFTRLKMPTIKESLQLTYKRFNGQGARSQSKKRTEGINFI